MPKLMLWGEMVEEECIELMRLICAHIEGKLPTLSVLESISVVRNKIVLT